MSASGTPFFNEESECFCLINLFSEITFSQVRMRNNQGEKRVPVCLEEGCRSVGAFEWEAGKEIGASV